MSQEINVFISYNIDTTEKIVEDVVKRLESKGIRCFYAYRNCNTSDSGFEKVIPDAIDECKVFVFMLNERSNNSEHCFNEIKLAFDRIANHEKMSIIVYRLDECIKSKSIKYYLCRSHEMRGTVPPEEERVNELINRILLRLEKMPMYGELDDEDFFGCQLVGNIVYPDSSFVGRRKEIEFIDKQLSSNINKLFLIGMGGIGKSEIVKKYLSENQNKYAITIWIPFEKSLQNTLCDDSKLNIKGLSREEYKEDNDYEYAKRKLDLLKVISERDVLIVIDNFDVNDDELLEDFITGRYSVIFTTRNHQKRKDISQYVVDKMQDENDLIDLFKIGYKREINDTNIEGIRKIIKYLDGHTLSLRLISKIMQERRIKPDEMLEILQNNREGVVSESSQKAISEAYTSIKMAFSLSALTKEEIKLLKNLSLFSIDGIDVELFYEWCEFEDYDIINNLVEKSWVINDVSTDIAHLHPLIAEIMHEKLGEDESDIKKLLDKVYDRCLHQVYYKYKEKAFDAKVVEYISEHLPESNSMYYNMRFAKGKAYSDISLFEKAKIEFEYCYKNAKTFKDKMCACHFLSQNEMIRGNNEKCYAIAMEGYQEFKDIDPLTWPEDAGGYCQNVLQRIGEGAKYMGHLEEALMYFKMAEEPCHRYALPGTTIYHSLGWVYYQISDVLYEMNRLDESEHYALLSKKSFEEGKEDWSYSFILSVLAKLYVEKKEFDKALEINKEAIDIRLEYDGKDSAGELYEKRGDIYLAMGLTDKAFECYDIAMASYIAKETSPKVLDEFKEKLAKIKR